MFRDVLLTPLVPLVPVSVSLQLGGFILFFRLFWFLCPQTSYIPILGYFFHKLHLFRITFLWSSACIHCLLADHSLGKLSKVYQLFRFWYFLFMHYPRSAHRPWSIFAKCAGPTSSFTLCNRFPTNILCDVRHVFLFPSVILSIKWLWMIS